MITVGGVDLGTLGFKAHRRQLPRLGGERSVVAQVPGRVGGVRTGAAVESARIVVEGTLSGADHETMLEQLDALSEAVRGERTIRFADIADREWVGRLQAGGSSATELGPAWITRGETIVLEWLLPDPTAQAQSETEQAPGALDLGTAPSPLQIEVSNAATAEITRVVVEVLVGGAPLRTLQWDGALATGSDLVIDTESFTVTNDGANAIDGLSAESEFPVADPDEGATVVAVTITGGGGHTTTVRYRKRWW